MNAPQQLCGWLKLKHTGRPVLSRGLVFIVLALFALPRNPAWAKDGQPDQGLSTYRQDYTILADKGPLEGKSFSPHYLIFFNLPGLSARPPRGTHYALGLSTYLSQEFLAAYTGPDDDIPRRYADFENLSPEAFIRWYPSPRLQLGATLRLIGYWGGILDRPVESFHEFFGFPNAGREFYGTGEVFVDYSSAEGYRFFLNQPQLALGDTDLWAVVNFIDTSLMAAALFGGLKLPTGSFDSLSGSDGADIAVAALFDLNLHQKFSIYLNTGLTLALTEPHAAPDTRTSFAQAILALEYAIDQRLSVLLQANLKSPSMHASIITMNNLGQIGDQLSFPQTNIKFGIRKRSGSLFYQVYMEEDALTNNGVDFTLNFSVTRLFSGLNS